MSRKNIDLAPSNSWYLRENRPSVTICSLSLIIIGILMIFAGGFISYIYFTEITPPNYDAYYQRYVGSSFPRILGELYSIFLEQTHLDLSFLTKITFFIRHSHIDGRIDFILGRQHFSCLRLL